MTNTSDTTCVIPPGTPQSPLDLTRFPSDVIHLLFLAFDDLPQSTLYNLIQCSSGMYDRFAPILYRTINIDKNNAKSVFAGLEGNHTKCGISGRIGKKFLLNYTQRLTINDLPSLEHLSNALTPHRPSPSANPYFPSAITQLFRSLTTLKLSSKAIMGLADLYNSSSWGSSPFNIPSQPILRALRYNIKPKHLTLDYPCGVIGIHLHSCIEEVISYIAQLWDLDTLTWTNLNRSMVGPVPTSRKLIYEYRECTHPAKASETLKGCPEHYDHISLTCSTFIDHLHSLPYPSLEEVKRGVESELEIRGVGCMFSLEWERVVDEIWSRMGMREEGDWERMGRWYRARIGLFA
ncbi:hypothetical protein I302_100105 [Kwoniella bestiolae CBS 10118]|uniref:Uncharacterized protein n=1 Tax=Kwoniella bestiolae CBS 10118 TaxID=1296100 RepID=A0A1B9G457_9TREE|nr:hypothetical protein I302_03479 [Kwoniella bestiolae CBS 10118]OCF25806.1 hypothetical protein I302_03479 [Kwoniella bestiolae CBS 10118]